MVRFLPPLLTLLALLVALPAPAQDGPGRPLAFDEGSVGKPGSGRPGELYMPPGPGPFPAVVLLHGCSGAGGNMRAWARRVVGWGYAALVVDSLRPRGVDSVCGRAQAVAPRLRAGDAFAAAAYLRTRPDIDPERIAVVGFSHGGSTALVASTRGAAQRYGARPFRAVVSFYPWCPAAGAPLASDVLVLIGDADDWTPAERCTALRAGWSPAHGSLALHVYPGALHAFDAATPERVFHGHRLGHDPAAAADAFSRSRAFLAERFGL